MSSKTTAISLIAIVLLFFGAAIVLAPQYLSSRSDQQPLQASDEYTYISDLDFWQRTPRERLVAATARFDLDHSLEDIPLQVGDWHGENAPETNQEVMILLEPEQYVQRLYTDSQNRELWLTMIGGRSSQPFHAPDICYDADGWQYDLGSHATTLPDGGELYGLWLDATKQDDAGGPPWEHVVYYFYLFPNEQRDLSDGIVLFKLTSGKYGSLEETLAMQAEFVQEFFSASRPSQSPAATAQR